MNRKTLQKIIEEIKKEPFRKDYVLGILETLLEGMPEADRIEEYKIPVMISGSPKKNSSQTNDMSEADILNSEAKARLGNIDLTAIKNG